MEYRLLKIIMKPAMVLTYIFGFLLVYDNIYLVKEVYFILKLFFVVFLTIFHFYLSILYKDFQKGYRFKSSNFYRKINVVPTVLMILIISLVVIKPNLQIFLNIFH